MTRQAPRIATRLLTVFSSEPNGDNISGDLAERYGAGRPRSWYWRQVAVAIAFSLVRQIRTRPWRILLTVMLAWGMFLSSIPLQRLLFEVVLTGRVIRSPWTSTIMSGGLTLPPRDLLPITGWSAVLAETWTNTSWKMKHAVMFPGGLISDSMANKFAVLRCVIAFVFGWLLGRIHKTDSVKAVTLFLASWLALLSPGLLFTVGQIFRNWSLPYWRSGHVYFLVVGIVSNTTWICGILAGAVLSTTVSRRQLEGGPA